ncbi:MATE family efflux transporter [Vibrio sp. RC27]
MQSQTTSLSRQLVHTTWPMVFGVLSLMSFQLVDSAFIGQLGVLPLAAQGFTMPMQMIIIGIQVGLGIATTSVISKAIGEKKNQYAQQLGALILTLGTFSIGVIALLIYLFRNILLSMLDAPQNLYAIIDSYWIIWLAGAWLGSILYFLYSVCRSNGNTVLPGSMMVVTSVLNIALDPIFIFYFDLGIQGAAWATIISFGLGIVIVAPRVVTNRWMVFDWKGLNLRRSLSSIFHIMGPAMISQLFPPLSAVLATKLLASFGAAAVAAWAVAIRFEFFAIVPVLALTMSMPPMIGRRLGEGNIGEIRQLVAIAAKSILIYQTALALITLAMISPMTALMTSDIKVQSILTWHLTLVPFSLGFLGICILLVSTCNAIGRPYTALTVSALRLFVFFLPCLWVGAQLYGIQGLFYGAFMGNVLAGIVAWSIYQRAMQSIQK